MDKMRQLRTLPLFCFLTLLVGLNAPAWAQLDFEDHAYPELVTSARALAMGNAYLNKVDDSWAAFYNPAGLGTVRGPYFHLGNLHMEGSSGLMRTMGSGPVYEAPLNYINSFDPEFMRQRLARHQGVLSHSRFNMFPNFTVRGMTLGYMLSQRNRAVINDDAANLFEIAERRDHGPVWALNASLFGGVLKFGGSAMYVIRRDLYKALGPTDPTVINPEDSRYGRSLQITGATRLTLPWTYLPTFSLVLRNATNNDWERINESAGPPDRIRQTMDAGFSITPNLTNTSRLHLEINLRDIHNAYDTSSMRRMALGGEIDFNRRIFIRGGYGDGWGSAGIGVRSRTFIFDLSTYAVDRSQDGFRRQEDRRWAFSISSGI
jgi:hypothetical protein